MVMVRIRVRIEIREATRVEICRPIESYLG